MGLPSLEILFKWNYRICDLLCLAFCSSMFSRLVRPCGSIPLHGLILFHHLVVPCFVGLLAVTVIQWLVWVLLWTFVSKSLYIFNPLACILRRGFAGLYLNSMFNFLKKEETVSQSGCCIILHPHRQCTGLLVLFLTLSNDPNFFFSYRLHNGTHHFRNEPD